MVHPQLSPKDALERIKLMMNYDLSKTSTENKKTIKEQYVGPSAAGAATGAAIGAAAGAALPSSIPVAAAGTGAIGTGAASGLVYSTAGALGVSTAAAGAIVGGAASLAILPLVYWLVTKDKGANKVKKMFEVCSSEASKIAKLGRKLSDSDLRDMADDVEDSVNYQTLGFIPAGTDEEKLFSTFNKFKEATAADFCAFVKYYNSNSDSGDLYDDLDSDIDSEEEWKQIYRPIRNCVEDTLLKLTDEEKKKEGDKPVTPRKGSSFVKCSGTYKLGCMADAVGRIQSCLGGLTIDDKFGPKTLAKLKEKGFGETFTDEDIPKICAKPQDKPEVGPEVQSTGEADL